MNIAVLVKPENADTVEHLGGNRYSSGEWPLAEWRDAELIGGRVSLHTKRAEWSYQAGEILSIREVSASGASGKGSKRKVAIEFEAGGPAVDGSQLDWVARGNKDSRTYW
ncbi:MAG: hypothetical protein GDA55_01135 [Cellvibrionales bacterium]|nr:hypothetical protein [Cellvibrionales bacterium]